MNWDINTHIIKCPYCGNEHSHIKHMRMCAPVDDEYCSEEQAWCMPPSKAITVVGKKIKTQWRNREGGVEGLLECENCHKWYKLRLCFHKGMVIIETPNE